MSNFSNEEYDKSIKAQGGVVAAVFDGSNREFNSPLEVGDKFKIPEPPFKVYKTPITGSSTKYQYLRLEVTTASGTTEYKNVGASVFNRRLPLVDESGNATNDWGMCDGTASDEFHKHGRLQDAFTALAGKTIEVKDKRTGMTRSFDPTKPYATSTFFTVDIVK